MFWCLISLTCRSYDSKPHVQTAIHILQCDDPKIFLKHALERSFCRGLCSHPVFLQEVTANLYEMGKMYLYLLGCAVEHLLHNQTKVYSTSRYRANG